MQRLDWSASDCSAQGKQAAISVPSLTLSSSQLNQKLLTTINASGKLHMVPANVNDYFVIRFCVCAQNATSSDIGK